MAENKIRRLNDTKKVHNTKIYKPILLVGLCLLIFVIIALILFKDSFKLNSIDSYNESTTLLYNKKLKDVYNKLNITSDFANIYITESEDNYIEIYMFGDKSREKVKKDGKTLNVNLDLACTICHNVNAGKIVVSLPKGSIEKINIDSHYGDITFDDMEGVNVQSIVEYGDFNAIALKDINATLKSGNIKISKVENIISNCDIGNVTIGQVNSFADIKTIKGNVVITDLNATVDSNIESETGSITIVNNGDLFYIAKSNHGKISLPEKINKSKTKVKLTTDVGNISVDK